jgi:hypothetical protein
MESSTHISFEQLKQYLQQLSPKEVEEVKTLLEDLSKSRKSFGNREKLEELVLKGPILSEEEIGRIEEARRIFNKRNKSI